MRIVSGAWKGKRLLSPAGEATRPTSDRARQAIFNILDHAPWSPGVSGAHVLDLFAGTGALGLEALSRGAASATFVESARPALAALRANLDACGAGGRGRVWPVDATRMSVPKAPPEALGRTLVFLDPPYGKGLADMALNGLAQGFVAPGAVAMVETGRGETLAPSAFWRVLDERAAGAARLWFLMAPAA
jgi:16S rRNA (guanine966-N2)-methyltransferase